MSKKSARDSRNRGGDLRKNATQSVIDNAIQLPFQGIARIGEGRDRMTISAGLFKGKGRVSAGINIKF